MKKADHQRIDAFQCGAGEDSWKFLECKEVKPINLKGNQP